MLSKELEVTLNAAFTVAHAKRHEFVSVEHLLLALLDNVTTIPILIACGCNVNALRGELTRFIDENISLIPDCDQRETQPTLGFQRVLQRAVFHVQASDKKEVIGANLFVALFSEDQSHAVNLLNKQDITRQDVVNFLAHGITKVQIKNNEAEEISVSQTLKTGSELAIDIGASSKVCFQHNRMLDNHPRTQLCFIIEQYGRVLINEPKRCRGMLKDLASHHTRETNLLIAALEQKVAEELLKPNSLISVDMQIESLAKRLHDNLGTQLEFAFWAVESWALALNIIQEPVAIHE